MDHTLSAKTAKFTSLENLYQYGIQIANNHGNQKYSELYRNDFNTWLKVLGIVWNEIYRYRPSLVDTELITLTWTRVFCLICTPSSLGPLICTPES